LFFVHRVIPDRAIRREKCLTGVLAYEINMNLMRQ
jgi:hypothetical protein